MKRQRASKEPYEGYRLPAVSEKGGQFVDFNKIIERKSIKRVRIRRKRNEKEIPNRVGQ